MKNLQPLDELLGFLTVGSQEIHQFHHIYAALPGFAFADKEWGSVQFFCRLPLRQTGGNPRLAQQLYESIIARTEKGLLG